MDRMARFGIRRQGESARAGVRRYGCGRAALSSLSRPEFRRGGGLHGATVAETRLDGKHPDGRHPAHNVDQCTARVANCALAACPLVIQADLRGLI
jgi:hypothetical protein